MIPILNIDCNFYEDACEAFVWFGATGDEPECLSHAASSSAGEWLLGLAASRLFCEPTLCACANPRWNRHDPFCVVCGKPINQPRA